MLVSPKGTHTDLVAPLALYTYDLYSYGLIFMAYIVMAHTHTDLVAAWRRIVDCCHFAPVVQHYSLAPSLVPWTGPIAGALDWPPSLVPPAKGLSP